jgi:hypothetical protein
MDTATFTMPLSEFNERFLHDLKEQNPHASVEIRLKQPLEKPALTEEEFWSIINQLDWSKKTDAQIIEPAISLLTEKSLSVIYSFQNILSEKLYQLDTKVFAQNIGQNAYKAGSFFSVDNFLYARCCVISNGRVAFNYVINNPTQMPKDITFETLLSLAQLAYQRKTGQRMRFAPSHSIETFSNKLDWV